MAESLLIVESPTKARTLAKYLDKSFKIIASMGHVKDLPKTKMGVDVKNGYKPEYQVIEGKKKVIQQIKSQASEAANVFLAPDPDREGEAIAWHIAEEIGRDREGIYRILFNEITRKGIEEGLRHPQSLDESKYESQQARRILDRLVGYELSPLLWKKVKRGLSAGRVQSVALRLIVQREREIRAFVPAEFWKVFCELCAEPAGSRSFRALLVRRNGARLKIQDEKTAGEIKEQLLGARWRVKDIRETEKRRNPPPPFITSRLQQEATRRLKLSARKVMQLAQQLYEGVELGSEGAVGLITYMRTDSTRLAADAVDECRAHLLGRFGQAYLPAAPNVYPQKKSAQGAHEAIRPTSLGWPPEKVRSFLTKDQAALYSMIWDRFLACQMTPAVFAETKAVVEAAAGGADGGRTLYDLESVGTEMKFDGWMAAQPDDRRVTAKKSREAQEEENGEGAEEGKPEEEEEAAETQVPPLRRDEPLLLTGEKVAALQKFTKPPFRFTEGTLIKELEDKGIGRPSTYATIISTILDRSYVKKFKYNLFPTPLGEVVVDRLVEHFPEIMDIEFTARMEESLDQVENRSRRSIEVLESFYPGFHKSIETAFKSMRPGSEHEAFKANGGPGGTPFVPIETETPCPKCGKKMVLKSGRYGLFLSCRDYPRCRESSPPWVGTKCPVEGCAGEIVERRVKSGGRGRSRKGFYGCSRYTEGGCTWTIWETPLNKKCPACGAAMLVIRSGKEGMKLACVKEGCGHAEDLPV